MHFSTLLVIARVALLRSSWHSCFMRATLFKMRATNSSLVFIFLCRLRFSSIPTDKNRICTRQLQRAVSSHPLKIGHMFKKIFYVVRHLDSTASYLPSGFQLGFFRSWPSLYLPSSFSSVFLVLSFVSASTSMLF